MSDFLSDNRFLVTGHKGFLGKRIVGALLRGGAEVCGTAGRDLRDETNVTHLLKVEKPTVIIHCAARVGGIGVNRERPAELLYDNLIMGALLIDIAHDCGIKKVVNISTVCTYPKFTPVPFREENLWDGYPEESNAPYGIAKKAIIVMGQAYRAQYGMNVISLILANLYGEGQDSNPQTSHVIPALIRRLIESKQAGVPSVTIWGTGEATRDFLYVDDAARAILLASERYDGAEPVNVGTGVETRIADLAAMLAEFVGYTGELVFDASKPDGQPRRVLDTSRAKTFGFEATMRLNEGLRRTVLHALVMSEQKANT